VCSEKFDPTLEAYDLYCEDGDYSGILRNLAARSFPGTSATALAQRDKFLDVGNKIMSTIALETNDEDALGMTWPGHFYDDATNYHGPFHKFRPSIMNFMTSANPLEECVSTYRDYEGTPRETVS
jgi:hypothetical protein